MNRRDSIIRGKQRLKVKKAKQTWTSKSWIRNNKETSESQTKANFYNQETIINFSFNHFYFFSKRKKNEYIHTRIRSSTAILREICSSNMQWSETRRNSEKLILICRTMTSSLLKSNHRWIKTKNQFACKRIRKRPLIRGSGGPPEDELCFWFILFGYRLLEALK